jgi:lysophospholipase L1-like esterase
MRLWAVVAVVAVLLVAAGVVLFSTLAGQGDPRPARPVATPSPTAESPAVGDGFTLPGPGAEVLYFGDSWTAGYSASWDNGYAWQSAAANTWKPLIYGNPGSGYIVGGPSGVLFQSAFEALPPMSPQLVILQGGINDAGDYGDVTTAARTLIGTAQARFPDAQIVVLGPAPFSWPLADGVRTVDASLERAARESGVPYISPVQEEWLTGENIGAFIDPATLHPNDQGHAYFAERLNSALTDLAART